MAGPDPGRDAARLEVLKARDDLLGEVERLGASARAATDIRAQVRAHPGKAVAAIGGASFLALGGPRRVLRGIRRVVRGPATAYPASLLPDQVEKVVRSLGADGDRVRGVLEREFANYVTEKKRTEGRAWRSAALGVLVPAVRVAMKSGARSFLDPEAALGGDVKARVREALRAAGITSSADEHDAAATAAQGPAADASGSPAGAGGSPGSGARTARPGWRSTRPEGDTR